MDTGSIDTDLLALGRELADLLNGGVGRRVATFDADIEQQTLTRYLENRQTWGRVHDVQLELPDHYPITEVAGPNLGRNEVADAKRFALAISMLEERYDYIVIDTPSGGYYLSLLAHAMADTLVTPINDSFVDLDLIGTIGPSTQFGPRRSRYIETVARRVTGGARCAIRPPRHHLRERGDAPSRLSRRADRRNRRTGSRDRTERSRKGAPRQDRKRARFRFRLRGDWLPSSERPS